MDDWFSSGRNGTALDVPALLDSDAGRLLHEMAGTGALVSLGLTRDGGALGVTVLVDGQYRREYFRECEGLAEWLGDGLGPVRERVAVAKSTRVSPKYGKSLRSL